MLKVEMFDSDRVYFVDPIEKSILRDSARLWVIDVKSRLALRLDAANEFFGLDSLA